MTEGLEGAKKQQVRCSVCGKEFQPRFRYQQQERDGRRLAYCSSRCQLSAMAAGAEETCSACGKTFVRELAFQTAVFDGQKLAFCSLDCRAAGAARPTPVKRLAVYNLKGGTGKTTTAVNLAAALAGLGVRVLLVDADPQGSVGVSLGAKARRGLYQVLVLGTAPESCIVTARPNLDVILSDRTLAGAEIFLAGRPERHRVMHDRLASLEGYDVTVIDCSPSVGLLSRNALRAADAVLVPVSCDYLGFVGLQQAVSTMQDLERRTGHRLENVGVLPTFHDGRLRACREAMAAMRQQHGALVLPPIRINTALRESPARRHSIFEHAPRSTGAADYQYLGEWFLRHHLHRTVPSAPSGDERLTT